MTNIMEAFANVKATENGDIAYNKVSNNNNLLLLTSVLFDLANI